MKMLRRFAAKFIALRWLATLITVLLLLVLPLSYLTNVAPIFLIMIILQVGLAGLLLNVRGILGRKITFATRKISGLASGKPAEAALRRPLPVSTLDREPSLDDEVLLVLGSGIFDLEWYERQSAINFSGVKDACKHYLTVGRRLGYSPHPLFIPSWTNPKNWRDKKVDPLVDYLRNAKWSLSPHPLFDAAVVGTDMDSPYGPLSKYIRHLNVDSLLPTDHMGGPLKDNIRYTEFRALCFESASKWRDHYDLMQAKKGVSVPPVSSPSHHQALAELASGQYGTPLVSVILPTWNRAKAVRRAIESVQAQTYSRWELVVADDGSTDDTLLAVRAEAKRDPRITVVALDHGGVCRARNEALAVASGEYVAFIDSDKEWAPEFLENMLAGLLSRSSGFGYCSFGVEVSGVKSFADAGATYDGLIRGNTIDQAALMVKRSLLQQVGGFDVSLRRAVDYDLILRLCRLEKPVFVPFVGLDYSEDPQDANRISEYESVAWNFFVRDQQLWNDFEIENSLSKQHDLLTIVIEGVRGFREPLKLMQSIIDSSGTQPVEFILISSNDDWSTFQNLLNVQFSSIPCRVLAGDRQSRLLSLNQALREARGANILYLQGSQYPFAGDLENMIGKLETSAAVHPLVLDSSRLIYEAGWIYTPSKDPIPYLRGMSPENVRGDVTDLPSASFPLLVRTSDAQSIRGFDTRLKSMWADLDFAQRVADFSNQVILLDSECVFQQSAPNPFEGVQRADIAMFAELWPDGRRGTKGVMLQTGHRAHFSGHRPFTAHNPGGRMPSAIWEPMRASVTEPAPRLRWAIQTAAPADASSRNWGDFHFAQSLAASLRRLGQFAAVDYKETATRDSVNRDDVVLNLRGLRNYPLSVSTVNLLWIISHPEEVAGNELRGYDLCYAASDKWAKFASSTYGTEVRALLQCTDSTLFHPDREEVPDVFDKILMVGNSRKQYRPAAWHAANARLNIAIYGSDWNGRVPAEAIAGDSLDNGELGRYYSSARYTLNDHWPDMRDSGFISNRIFDVIASGGRLVTDDVDGISRLFPHGIAVFRSPLELLRILDTPPEAIFPSEEQMRANALMVRNEHSFDARARRLLDDVLPMWRAKHA